MDSSLTDQTVNRKDCNRRDWPPGWPGIARTGSGTSEDSARRFFRALLKGLYQPVPAEPWPSMVDLSDGSYSTTRIYPVDGIRVTPTPPLVGDFYVQSADLAYIRPRRLVFDAVHR